MWQTGGTPLAEQISGFVFVSRQYLIRPSRWATPGGFLAVRCRVAARPRRGTVVNRYSPRVIHGIPPPET